MIAVQVVLALSVSMIADSYNPAHDNVLLFYTLAFVKHCMTVTCIVAGTSFLFDNVSPLKTEVEHNGKS